MAAFLKRAPYGFLATVGPDAQPFLNANLFVFDDGSVGEGDGGTRTDGSWTSNGDDRRIYLHTHRTGRTRDNIEAAGGEPAPSLHAPEPKVAFGAVAMGRLLPAPEALEFSVEYAGVIAFGTGRVVEDPVEAKAALQMLLDKYAPHLRPGADYRPTTDDELRRTAVYRIDVETWSGKQKEVDPHFPGAFALPGLPVPFSGPEENCA